LARLLSGTDLRLLRRGWVCQALGGWPPGTGSGRLGPIIAWAAGYVNWGGAGSWGWAGGMCGGFGEALLLGRARGHK
jgi:hypothetical protein